jgi:hypothetical protein
VVETTLGLAHPNSRVVVIRNNIVLENDAGGLTYV